jgi:ribonuclease J
LLSDSTNIDSPGFSQSETDVAVALQEIIERAPCRVVLGVFASNVQRLLAVAGIAQRTGRRVCLLGRSVGNHVRAAKAIGRLPWPSDLVVAPEVAAALPRERVLVLASGTQAERTSGLSRLATGTHSHLRLDRGDLVVLSSRIIPGNDRAVFDLIAALLRKGADVVSRITDPRVHASGHAHREEQRRMIELTRPQAFVPIHGTLHHLVRHAALAKECGVDEILIVENGDVVEIERERPPAKVGRAVTGRVATAGSEVLAEEVIGQRAQLGRSGIVFVSLVLDHDGALAGDPKVVSRGVFAASSTATVHKIELAVGKTVTDADAKLRANDDSLIELARASARRNIESHTGRRPLVVATVTRL